MSPQKMIRYRFHYRYQRPAPSRSFLISLTALLAGFLMAGVLTHVGRDLAARRRAAAHEAAVSFAQADQDEKEFLRKTSGQSEATDCTPVTVRDDRPISIAFLDCPEAAYVHDGEEVTITERFRVPASIARRYNFWRRVYSVYSKDQYVLHAAEYPEVVIESLDASHLGAELGPVARENRIKKAAKPEREVYRKLLLTMDENRDHEDRFTPAMKRLAASMAHIKDPHKYRVAAQSLRLQRGQRDFIARGLTVAPKYLASIEAEFRSQGIPVEITRLAFVESSFNLKAQSKVGASGVYQIMPATGHQYLKMFDGVDERNDPIKASRAAAKLLRLNYDLTGTWPLAITAYNHGVGGIRRATHEVGSNDIVDLINNYRGNQFGFASKNFYASFLGVLATLKEADRLFPEVPKVQALSFAPLRLAKPTTVRELCRKYTVSTVQLAALNPDISARAMRSPNPLPRGFVIKLPASKAARSATLASVDLPR